jgi:hypothetical protein
VLRIATERAPSLTDRQLRTLGLIYVVHEYRFKLNDGPADERFRAFVRNCEDVLAPFMDVDPLRRDLAHMEGLNLLRYHTLGPIPKGGRWSVEEDARSWLLDAYEKYFDGQPFRMFDASDIVSSCG